MRALSGRAIAVAPEPRSGTAFGEGSASTKLRLVSDLQWQIAIAPGRRHRSGLAPNVSRRAGPTEPPAGGRHIRHNRTGRVINPGK
jgi:hypothetical protein